MVINSRHPLNLSGFFYFTNFAGLEFCGSDPTCYLTNHAGLRLSPIDPTCYLNFLCRPNAAMNDSADKVMEIGITQ